MKHIEYHRKFEKNFARRVLRDRKLLRAYDERFLLLAKGHRDQPINDHALTGSMQGKRSFSITGDVRVIYEETDDMITFLDIGTHSQVY